ncbi:MAG: hypothetical protein IJS14_14265 [Lentisphaeria bacterium]|nr:hypothetical protein [Lentisphaeria bacterium]
MSPAELPVAGKAWCFHAVDFCSRLQVSEVMIADSCFSAGLAMKLGNGTYWSLKLKYIASGDFVTPEKIFNDRKKFAESEDVLVIWGLVLPDVADVNAVVENLLPADELDGRRQEGIYLLRQGKLYECVCPMFRLDSLKNYFDSNFRMLSNPGIYSLPGYSMESGIGIGMNVVMMPDCDVAPPVIIQDNAWIGDGAVLRNGAIIGRIAVVDANTRLDHSIVMSNTYVGRNMLLKDKIIRGKRVIDPETGTYLDLEDQFLVGSVESQGPGFYHQLFEQLVALVCAVAEFPLYLLALPLRKRENMPPFVRMLLRAYPKFWKVLAGRAQLVKRDNGETDYVFRYADLWYPTYRTEQEKDLVDSYYIHHCSIFQVLRVVVFGQVRRLMMITDPDKNNNGSGSGK